MNEKLPKPMLDALARGAAPAEHPSADVLAAFVERSLAEGEKPSVTDHLARCGECREIVFLASEATEVATADHQRVVAKPGWRTSRWIWAVPAAVVLLLVAGYFVRQRYVGSPAESEIASRKTPETVIRAPGESHESNAVQLAPAVVPAPSSVAKSRPQAGPPVTAAAQKARPAGAEVLGMNAAPPAPATSEGMKVTAAATKPAQEPTTIATSGALAGPAPAAPIANGFASSNSETAQRFAADSLNLSVNRGLANVVRIAHPGWRVTQEGHLEHVTPDGWVRVLGDQTSVFRVVGVIGSDVWAGGNGGMLFHSSDGGGHWSRVSISSPSGTETAAIVSIRFDDSQHGVVITDTGASYSTTDGGASWAKQ